MLTRKNLMNLCFSSFRHSVPLQLLSIYQKAEDNNQDTNTGTFSDFATAVASRRFFVSSPGLSNSIIDSSSSSSSNSNYPPESDYDVILDRGGVATITTNSLDPYLDFRRSMEEMFEARCHLFDVKSNWKWLSELLLCYLALNPKSTHKLIVAAFADMLVNLTTESLAPAT